MAQTFTQVQGTDEVIAAPPLVDPPLSLLGCARQLIDIEGQTATKRIAAERLASAQDELAEYLGDTPGEPDSEADASQSLKDLQASVDSAAAWLAIVEAQDVSGLQRFEHGFRYLPELPLAATGRWGIGSNDPGVSPAVNKPTGNNQTPTAWNDPFVVWGRDDRSAFGWPGESLQSRLDRAERALRAHRSWQVEREWWTGETTPTNYHLTASPSTATSSPDRTVSAFPNPTFPLGSATAASLGASLAALDQAIAEADGGTGIVHASAYLVQRWSAVYPFLRDPDGKIYTVNHNLIVPGYGYPGTGPDAADRPVTDGNSTSGSTDATSASAAFTVADVGRPISGDNLAPGTTIAAVVSATEVTLSLPATGSGTTDSWTISGTGGDAGFAPVQWAYATDMVFYLLGDVQPYPVDLRDLAIPAHNAMEVRAEQNVGLATNQLLRAAVPVDTTTP